MPGDLWMRLLGALPLRRHRAEALLGALLMLITPSAWASQVGDGTYIDIYYGSNGSWADTSTSRGLEIVSGSTVRPVTWPGSPWAQTTIEYNIGSTAYNYSGNYTSATYTTVAETNLSSGTTNKLYYKWTAGSHTIERTETWEDADKAVQMKYEVTNNSTSDVSTFRLLVGIDPDQDNAASPSTLSDYADTVDIDGDGVNDAALSSGVTSGWTVLYGACDEAKQDFGHGSWPTDADAVFSDRNGVSGDYEMVARHKEATIPAGNKATFYLLFG